MISIVSPLVRRELRKVFRQLHGMPELGHREFQTSRYIEGYLHSCGIKDVQRIGNTSICAMINGRDNACALHADIDAASVQDEESLRMVPRHVCGHDGHVAILLVLARMLSTSKLLQKTAVVLLFQEAEESTPSGAPAVIGELPKNLSINEIYKLHLCPELETGVIGVRSGTVKPSVDGLTVDILAKHPGRLSKWTKKSHFDALEVMLRVYGMLRSRTNLSFVSASRPVCVTVGRVTAGERPNSPSRKAKLEATLRCIDRKHRNKFISELRARLRIIAEETHCEVDIQVFSDIRPPVVNNPLPVSRIIQAAPNTVTILTPYPEKVLTADSDDFGWYSAIGSTAYMLLGCKKHGRETPPIHSPDFVFDERALAIGLQMLHSVVNIYERGSKEQARTYRLFNKFPI